MPDTDKPAETTTGETDKSAETTVGGTDAATDVTGEVSGHEMELQDILAEIEELVAEPETGEEDVLIASQLLSIVNESYSELIPLKKFRIRVSKLRLKIQKACNQLSEKKQSSEKFELFCFRLDPVTDRIGTFDLTNKKPDQHDLAEFKSLYEQLNSVFNEMCSSIKFSILSSTEKMKFNMFKNLCEKCQKYLRETSFKSCNEVLFNSSAGYTPGESAGTPDSITPYLLLSNNSLPVFTGNPLEYGGFKSAFKSQIEQWIPASARKAFVLKCIKDKALRTSLESDEYEVIWHTLDVMFMQGPRIVLALNKEWAGLKPCRNNSDILKLIACWHKTVTALKNSSFRGSSEHLDIFIIRMLGLLNEPHSLKVHTLFNCPGEDTSSRIEITRYLDSVKQYIMDTSTAGYDEKPAKTQQEKSSNDKGESGAHVKANCNAASASKHSCLFCKTEGDHDLINCTRFGNLSCNEQVDFLMGSNTICFFCGKSGHRADSCFKLKNGGGGKECGNCGHKKHNTFFCEISRNFFERIRQKRDESFDSNKDKKDLFEKTALMTVRDCAGIAEVSIPAQKIYIQDKGANVVFDSGSNVNLISSRLSRELELEGAPCDLVLNQVGNKAAKFESKKVCFELKDKNGKVHTIYAYIFDGIPPLKSQITREQVARVVGVPVGRIEKEVEGKVDLLIGAPEMKIFPRTIKNVEKLILNESLFSHRLLVAGSIEGGGKGGESECVELESRCLQVSKSRSADAKGEDGKGGGGKDDIERKSFLKNEHFETKNDNIFESVASVKITEPPVDARGASGDPESEYGQREESAEGSDRAGDVFHDLVLVDEPACAGDQADDYIRSFSQFCGPAVAVEQADGSVDDLIKLDETVEAGVHAGDLVCVPEHPVGITDVQVQPDNSVTVDCQPDLLVGAPRQLEDVDLDLPGLGGEVEGVQGPVGNVRSVPDDTEDNEGVHGPLNDFRHAPDYDDDESVHGRGGAVGHRHDETYVVVLPAEDEGGGGVREEDPGGSAETQLISVDAPGVVQDGQDCVGGREDDLDNAPGDVRDGRVCVGGREVGLENAPGAVQDGMGGRQGAKLVAVDGPDRGEVDPGGGGLVSTLVHYNVLEGHEDCLGGGDEGDLGVLGQVRVSGGQGVARQKDPAVALEPGGHGDARHSHQD